MTAARLRRSWRAGVVVLVLFAVWAVIVFSLQRALIFPRYATAPFANAGRDVRGLDRLYVDIDEGRVEAWLLPGDGVSSDAPGPLVIFAHGNAELIEHWPDELDPYRRMGVSVLVPEFRGYGRSDGTPSEEGIVDDFVRFYDMVVARPEIDAARVWFHGRSLGGGVACALSRQRTPDKLVLQSTFTSVPRLARRWLVPRFMIRDPFDNLGAVRRLDIPILIIHGTRDRLIPPEHARTLRDAASNGRLLMYDADHNSLPPDPERYWRDLRDFLSI